MADLSKSCREALDWLGKHNGTGCFERWPRHHVLLAAGEEAPFMRSTWVKLARAGLVTIAGGRVSVVSPQSSTRRAV